MGKKTENIVSNDPANSATGNRLQSIIDVSENWLRIQNGKDSVTKEKFCGEYKKQVLVRFRNSLISLFGTNRIDHIEDDVKKTVYNLLGTAKMFTINATDTLDSLELNRLVLTQHTMRELIKGLKKEYPYLITTTGKSLKQSLEHDRERYAMHSVKNNLGMEGMEINKENCLNKLHEMFDKKITTATQAERLAARTTDSKLYADISPENGRRYEIFLPAIVDMIKEKRGNLAKRRSIIRKLNSFMAPLKDSIGYKGKIDPGDIKLITDHCIIIANKMLINVEKDDPEKKSDFMHILSQVGQLLKRKEFKVEIDPPLPFGWEYPNILKQIHTIFLRALEHIQNPDGDFADQFGNMRIIQAKLQDLINKEKSYMSRNTIVKISQLIDKGSSTLKDKNETYRGLLQDFDKLEKNINNIPDVNGGVKDKEEITGQVQTLRMLNMIKKKLIVYAARYIHCSKLSTLSTLKFDMAHPQEITDAIHSISTNNDALIKSHDENTIGVLNDIQESLKAPLEKIKNQINSLHPSS